MIEIGPTLRDARMRARLDITEVERATKIRTKYLRALEDEEWGVLPGPTFARSFLRTYAEYLGLDARLLVEEYKRRYDRPAEHELTPIAPPRQRRGGRAAAAPAAGGGGGGRRRELLLVFAVLALVVGGLYALGTLAGGGSDGGTVGAPAPEANKEARARAKKRRAQAAAPKVARVTLVPTGQVYVCAVDERGRRLVPGVTLSPGATRSFSGRRIVMTLGNNSVRMRVNGRVTPVPPSAQPLGYVVTPAGRRPLPPGQGPTCT